MENLFLNLLFEVIQRMQNVFNHSSFFHVYRELNMEVNSLSKDRLSMEVGLWTMLGSKDGLVHEFLKSVFLSFFCCWVYQWLIIYIHDQCNVVTA